MGERDAVEGRMKEGRMKGRGATSNPKNRFEPLEVQLDPEVEHELLEAGTRTRFYRDRSKSIISRNDSPDLPFKASINPYKGCEHGCAYCYARPYHEYSGFSCGLDFESRILVKEEAPVLLEKELSAPRWRPQVLALSGATDCYQPVERSLGLTRGCLEVLARFRNPVGVITKNRLVTRDIDHLAELARFDAAVVTLSITSLDPQLAADLEPRAATPAARLETIRRLAGAGIPTTVAVAPVIPGLNDHELPEILAAARAAGARAAGYQALRLPEGVAGLFDEWLRRHRPLRRKRVLNRIRGMRGGRLTDGRFGHRMRGEGLVAEEIESLFRLARGRAGFVSGERIELSTRAFRRPGPAQGRLFS